MRSNPVPENPRSLRDRRRGLLALARRYPRRHAPPVSTATTTEQDPSAAARPGTGTIALLLAGFSFALHIGLALQLDAVESLDQFDVFFHADTQARLDCATRGICDHRSSISHPALDLLVNPPVHAIADLLSWLGAWQGDGQVARHAVALWLSPAAAALQSAWVFMLLLALGLSRLRAGLGSALTTLSLSGLLFGSIPESFALSSCAISGAFLLAVRSPAGEPPRRSSWLVLTVVATAITVTNLISIVVLFAAGRATAGDSPRRILEGSAQLAGAAAILTLMFGLISTALYDSRPLNLAEGTRYVTKWTEDNDPLERLARFPSALANSVAGVPPSLAPNYQANLNDSKYKFRFSFEDAPGVFSTARPLATFLLVLSLWGSWVMLRGAPPLRAAAVACLAILAWNAGLHAFWGVGLFLYSQHWQLAFCILLMGPLFLPQRFEWAGTALFAGLGVAVVAQNFIVGRIMLAHFSLP